MSTRTIHPMYPEDFSEYRSSHKERTYSLVDVRQPAEYTQEHIPGALNLPLPELEQHIARLDPTQDLIFYCRSGHRSQMAAKLAAETLEDTTAGIYNLLGGISAWSGIVLPDYPRIEVFDPQASIPDLLLRAMDMEKGAFRFYQEVAVRWPGAELEGVQEMERIHARSVYNLLQKHNGPEQAFDALFDSLSGETVEGGRPLQELLDDLQAYDQGGCLALAEMALDIEGQAYDLYRHLADTLDDRETAQSLLVLAEQEKGHMRIVAKKIPECIPG
ncbi:MAG: rhodanese-like domain-containing protein [Desulfovermiculus sp.]